MHSHHSFHLCCFQSAYCLVPERLLWRACLGSWQCERAELLSFGSRKHGVWEAVDVPWGGRGLHSASTAAWEGRGLESPTVGLGYCRQEIIMLEFLLVSA